MSQPSNPENQSAAMPAFPSESFDALDQILDDMRTRDDEIPQWEFCEGFMAAALCSRRPLPLQEVLGVLLGNGDDDAVLAFADAAQRETFETLWRQRAAELEAQLTTTVQALDEDGAF